MLADSELGDRQLPDQCSGVPGQIQWSVTKCDVVGPSDGASPLTSTRFRLQMNKRTDKQKDVAIA